MRLDELARVHLAELPTALEDAPRLAKAIGVERLLVKRDDLTGLALGGNKARKLEFLMAEAQAKGADIVLTCGGGQSNHARMTAAAARKLGMDAILFLDDPMPAEFGGNLLLDVILGAEIRFLGCVTYPEVEEAMAEAAAKLTSQGRTPYVIPVGGSTPVGAMGYVTGVREAAGQLKEMGVENVDIVMALGSAGTAAGTLLGCDLFLPDAHVIGISVSRSADKAFVRAELIADEAAEMIGVGLPDPSRLRVYDEYIGEGYAIPTKEGVEAILMAARTEGLILDPVYTGKAMAGLIDLARKGEIGVGRPVLFWHTGGAGGLFACEELFRDEARRLSSETG
jgi:D-cysteine desulfhydrase family pyridoxal phosphate-dependent enzyme